MLDLFTGWLFVQLDFFASGFGILLIGATTLLMILLWEWRLSLVGLIVVQVGVAILASKVHGLVLQWASVQLLVTALATLMLLLSAQQVRPALRQLRPGSWPVRMSAAILLLVSWRFLEIDLPLPIIAPQLAQLFFWIVLCGLVLLGLSDTPFFTGVALLLWFIPIQALIEILMPQYRLFVLIGMMELLVVLACSYLMLAQRIPAMRARLVVTDNLLREENTQRLLLGAGPSGASLPPLANGNGKHEPLMPPSPRPEQGRRERTGEHNAVSARPTL